MSGQAVEHPALPDTAEPERPGDDAPPADGVEQVAVLLDDENTSANLRVADAEGRTGVEEAPSAVEVSDEEVVVIIEEDEEATSAAVPAADVVSAGGSGGRDSAPVSQGGPSSCPICLDPLGSSGRHQAACLACGHLFGRSCILKWLRQSRKCPHCNARASAGDVRRIFVTNLTAVDDSEVEAAHQELKAERAAKEAAERTAKAAVQESRELRAEIQRLRDERIPKRQHELIDLTTADPEAPPAKQPPGPHRPRQPAEPRHVSDQPPFRLSTRIEIPAHQSRCFDISTETGIALISGRASDGAFDVRKVSLMAPTQPFRIPLNPHAGMVRDLCLSHDATKALVASVGRQPLAVLSVGSQGVVASLPAGLGAWSCAWDPACEHRVLAGLANGGVKVFDLRNPGTAFATFADLRASAAAPQPVHSLRVHTSGAAGTDWQLMAATFSGLLTFELRSAGAWDDVQAEPALSWSSGQPCVALASGPADVSCSVATFRGAPGLEPHHCVMTTSIPQVPPPPPSVEELPDRPPGHVEAVMGNAPDRQAALPEAAVPGLQLTVARSLEWRIFGRLGGHGFTSSATMSRTALVLGHQLPQPQQLPFFACADEQSKRMWLWDLSTGAIAQRFPAHEAHIVDVWSSSGTAVGAVAGSSSNRGAVASLSPRWANVYFRRH